MNTAAKSKTSGLDFFGCCGCPALIVVPRGQHPSFVSGWVSDGVSWRCGPCSVKATIDALGKDPK